MANEPLMAVLADDAAGTPDVITEVRGKIEKLLSDAFFLGMLDFATYASRPFRIDKGDILVAYSDGLTDAENQQAGMFG